MSGYVLISHAPEDRELACLAGGWERPWVRAVQESRAQSLRQLPKEPDRCATSSGEAEG